MEEIKEGEYIRTEYDGIGKILEVRYDPLRYVYDICSNIAFPDDITKHSPNIIDLIEEGDWVNEHRIVEIGIDPFNQKKILYTDDSREGTCGERCLILFHDEDIKSIVTKEQFETMKYEVIT